MVTETCAFAQPKFIRSLITPLTGVSELRLYCIILNDKFNIFYYRMLMLVFKLDDSMLTFPSKLEMEGLSTENTPGIPISVTKYFSKL